MSNVPESVTLNLDTVERDPEEIVAEPFTVVIGGRAITMTDPAELDWQDLLELNNPADFLRFCVSAEERRHIAAQRIPGWKLGKLMQAYMDHYRLEEQMDKARRMGRI